jgi:hypothetical protein
MFLKNGEQFPATAAPCSGVLVAGWIKKGNSFSKIFLK